MVSGVFLGDDDDDDDGFSVSSLNTFVSVVAVVFFRFASNLSLYDCGGALFRLAVDDDDDDVFSLGSILNRFSLLEDVDDDDLVPMSSSSSSCSSSVLI
jgi:hypothetical protein